MISASGEGWSAQRVAPVLDDVLSGVPGLRLRCNELPCRGLLDRGQADHSCQLERHMVATGAGVSTDNVMVCWRVRSALGSERGVAGDVGLSCGWRSARVGGGVEVGVLWLRVSRR